MLRVRGRQLVVAESVFERMGNWIIYTSQVNEHKQMLNWGGIIKPECFIISHVDARFASSQEEWDTS